MSSLRYHLTKYDFLQFLDCLGEVWLLKNRSDEISTPPEKHSLLNEQGRMTDELAKALFTDPAFLASRGLTAVEVRFQEPVEVEGLHIRCDILVRMPSGQWQLYEVKSSNDVKPGHLHDIAFQVVALQRAGYPIEQTFLVHCNGDYVRNGPVDVQSLLKVSVTTADVKKLLNITAEKIAQALEYVNGPPPPRATHYCSKEDACAFLRYQYPDWPDYSIFKISNLSNKKRRQLPEQGCYAVRDIPVDFPLTPRQRLQVREEQSREVHFEREQVLSTQNRLPYPHYFLDYETFGYAIPWQCGCRPNRHQLFQYFMHVQTRPGADLRHHEYLLDTKEEPVRNLVAHMHESFCSSGGTVIVWQKSFEQGRNKELAVQFPEFSDFLHSVNDRIFDLSSHKND